MSDLKRWHVTHVGSEKSPMIWRLEGSQAIAFGLSVGMAFFLLRILVDVFSWSLSSALPAAGLLPVTVLTVLLTLVKGKPKGHLKRWVEWQILKARSEELMVDRTNYFAVLQERLRRSNPKENSTSETIR